MQNKPNKFEPIFTRSKRPDVEFPQDKEDAIWLKVQTQTSSQPKTSRDNFSIWRLLLPIFSVGALAAVIIWTQAQFSGDTQLVNINQIENVNSNLNVNNELANSNVNMDVEPDEHVVAELEPRLIQPSLADYGNVGGCPFCEGYPVITFTDPGVLPEVSTEAVIQERTILSLPELYRLAEFFKISSDELIVSQSGNVMTPVDEFDCEATVLEDTSHTCLQITPYGSLLYTQPAGIGIDLSKTIELISSLTGRTATEYVVQDLGALPDNPFALQYRIYYPYSLHSDLPFRDIGWYVIVENDHLRSLGGHIIPDMNITRTTNLINSSEVMTLLNAGIDETTMSIDTYQLTELVRANPTPTITVESITLEYSFATSGTKVALIPVYYIRCNDLETDLPLEIYLDASESQNMFGKYRLRTH